jgi:hypothetical protein
VAGDGTNELRVLDMACPPRIESRKVKSRMVEYRRIESPRIESPRVESQGVELVGGLGLVLRVLVFHWRYELGFWNEGLGGDRFRCDRLGNERTVSGSAGSDRKGLFRKVVADSGLTQEGSPDLTLNEGPYLWIKKMKGTKRQKVVMP